MSQEGRIVLENTLNIFEECGISSDKMCEQITLLGSLNLWTLYILSENSQFIHAILDNNSHLNTVWKKLLKKGGFPDCEFVSRDKKIKVTLFSQIKGAVLLTAFDKYENKYDQPALEVLNKACDLGIYSALIECLNFYCDYIKEHINNRSDRETVDTYVQFIIRDTTKLCNLYGAMAHVDSAFVLFNVAGYYLKQNEHKQHVSHFFNPAANKFSWQDKYHAEDCPRPVVLFGAAIENLYMAELLASDPLSINACEQLLHSRDALAGFEGSYAGAKALEKTIKDKLTKLGIPLVDAFCDMSLNAANESLKKK